MTGKFDSVRPAMIKEASMYMSKQTDDRRTMNKAFMMSEGAGNSDLPEMDDDPFAIPYTLGEPSFKPPPSIREPPSSIKQP
jgi:hypothetical protein